MSGGSWTRFVELAARARPVFWLDGGGARPWSGAGRCSGALDEDDVSLTYDAGTPRGDAGTAATGPRWSATTSSRCCEELARDDGDPDVHWVGYFGYACRPDLPAPTVGDPACPTRSGCASRDRVVVHGHRDAGTDAERLARAAADAAVPDGYAAAFAEVQEQLRPATPTRST